MDTLIQNAEPVVPLIRKEQFSNKFQVPSDTYLGVAVNGFFENGGSRCYIIRAALSQHNPTDQVQEDSLAEAIKALASASLNDIDLIAVPDAVTLSNPEAIKRLQQSVIDYCSKQNCLAILDTFSPKQRDAETVVPPKSQIAERSYHAALYHPWIQVGVSPNKRFVPPCGHIAGIFARSDRTHGVFKAPANEEIRGAIGLETSISDTEQADLNAQGINCLRAFPGRSIRVWGARTLSSDHNWRYINVRRLFLTVKRWIDLNMTWAAFEPNTPQLWVRIQRELDVYLTQLWQAGGLKGETPEEAFYVKCDIETNPPESRENGNVITEIGLAPAAPAEFIIVQLTHHANATEMT